MKSISIISIIFMIAVASATAGVVSLNFGQNWNELEPHHMAASDEAGAPGARAANWNNVAPWGNDQAIVAADGTVVTAANTVQVNANEWWRHQEISPVDADEKMMSSFLADTPPGNDRSQNSASPSTLIVPGIGSYLNSGYYVYIYSQQESYDHPGVFTVSDGTSSLTVYINMAGQAVDFLSGSGFVLDAGGNYLASSDAADTGNYAVLGKFYGDTVTITWHGVDADDPAGYEGSWRGQMTGVQFSAVPEPATLALLGIGSFSIFIKKRK